MNRAVDDSVFDGDDTKDVFDEFEEYQMGADSGDCRSLVKLGRFYKDGKVPDEDQIAAFECFARAAETGDAEAEFELARCYYEGIGTVQNKTEGFKLLLRSSKQGNPYALSYLGTVYISGNGVAVNEKKGFDLIKESADMGCAIGKAYLSHLYRDGAVLPRDDAMYIQYLTEAAEMGDVKAQFELGAAYVNGWRVETDLEAGLGWLRRSSDAGEGEASYEVARVIHERDPSDEEAYTRLQMMKSQAADADAMMGAAGIAFDFVNADHPDADGMTTAFLETAMEMGCAEAALSLGNKYNGGGSAADHRMAFDLYRKAADMGSVEAIGKVGRCFEIGRGTEKDTYLAEAWYSRGDTENDAYCQFRLGIMKINGAGCDLRPDYASAIRLMKRSFNNGERRAATVLAEWHETFEDIKSMPESVYWYMKGAAAGEPKSMDRLAQHYLSGTYIRESQERAFDLYMKMAYGTDSTNIGHANVGRFYEEGILVETDLRKAREHYRKAAVRGNAFAMYRLSEMARARKSDDEMVFWLIGAASRGNVNAMMDLARRHETGDGVVKCHADAVEMYHRAAEKGSRDARDELERVLLEDDEDGESTEYLDMLYGTAHGRHGSGLLKLAEMRLGGTGGARRSKKIARMWCGIAKMYNVPGAEEMIAEINDSTKA